MTPTVNAMSSESRILRPYTELASFESLFQRVKLQVGRTLVDPGQRLEITPVELLTESMSVVVAHGQADIELAEADILRGLDANDLDESDLQFLVAVSSAYLKLYNVVWQGGLSDVRDRDWRIGVAHGADNRPPATRAIHHGCQISISLIFANERESSALKVWRSGTWISRADFRLSNIDGPSGFIPLPLNDSLREKFGLPRGTMRYIKLDDSPLNIRPEDDALELYIDEEVFAQLALDQDSAHSKAFQNQLFIDIATAVITKTAQDEELDSLSMDDESVRNSIVGELVRSIAGKVQSESDGELRQRQNEIFKMIRSHPFDVIARAEGLTDIQKNMRSPSTFEREE